MTASVMVVEDNPITRKLVRYALEGQRIEVVEAADGAAARRVLRARPVSLVLLDLLLPDIDGFDLLPQLRDLAGAEIPILAFSGLLSPADEGRLSAVGFDDVVTKPIEPSRLIQILRAHLPSPDARPAPVSAGRTVLIADDDPVQRKLVALRLARAGYKVHATADGEEALARAHAVKPDAIVSDVLMPRLDGFGLCAAIRNDPALCRTPIVLITNSYLDADDRALATRAGADHLLVRTPELRDVLEVLSQAGSQTARAPGPMPVDPELERDRSRRMMNQLERQVALQAGLSRRCALMSAELSVLSGISEAVATQHDLEAALQQVLASCFDAGGIALGTLYIEDGGQLRALRFGEADGWTLADLESFFGHRALLMRAIQSQALLCVPSEHVPDHESRRLLTRARVGSLLIAPLGYKRQPLGALVTVSRTAEQPAAERIAFTQAVASQISLALALARSFSEKDAAAREARANAAVLRSILDSMAEGVLVSDTRGAVTDWNSAAVAMLGLEDRGERPAVPAAFPLARAVRGEQVDRRELFLHQPDRPGAWLSVNARPLADDTGTHGGVAVFRDITAEKAAHAQLLVSDRMASLGMLAAGVGHEINNPLMAVLGNLDMVAQDLEALAKRHAGKIDLGEIPEALSDARVAAERVRNIVRDLKMFSRSDEESRGPVDVEAALESSIRMVWNEIRHRAALVRDYARVPPVLANEARLGQVFINILVNAVQALPEGGAATHRIVVATEVAADGRVRVAITDTGCGMPPEVVARIFTPFFTTKPIGVGTGLGLAICHQLIAAIGGEITVNTAPGRGTTFAILIPPAASEARVVAAEAPAAAAPVRGRVLVIDDDQMIGATLKRVLGHEHDVTALSDPHEAMRRIEAGERYDLIFCDLMMPTATGMDVHARLLATVPGQAARVVFITGGAFTVQAQRFLDRVPNPRLEKPVDVSALRRLVNERLRDGRSEEAGS